MMTKVYTDTQEGTTMKQRYAAPSLKVLGSLSELTLGIGPDKELGATPDGTYLFEHKKKVGPLGNVS